jgi:serine/threonine protein phosphatase PrpC
MDINKKVLKNLLEAKGFSITENELTLFEEFSELNTIKSNIELIQTKQAVMVEMWRKRTRINDFKQAHLIFPNATVGKTYNFQFDLGLEALKGIQIFEVKLDRDVNVFEFDINSGTITANFNEPGHFTVMITFGLDGDDNDELKSTKEIKVLVNADPKTLWKNLDSNKEDPYWKEDNISASAIFGTKNLIVGSKRGRSHAHEGIFRDDDYGFHFESETGWGIIAIADGAGSAKYSRKGSLLACNAVVDYFKNITNEITDILTDAIIAELKESNEINQKAISSFCITHLGKAAFSALNSIREEAKIKEAEIKDYSTTLLFAFIKEFDEQLFVSSFWVGDGGIGIYSKELNSISLLGVPDSGEFSGQTRFLTMSEIFSDNAYISRIKYKIVPKSAKLFLMSDGITDAKFQTDAALEKIEVWNEVMSDLEGKNEENHVVDFSGNLLEAEKQLMQWMDFWSPGNHDDRTIAILY